MVDPCWYRNQKVFGHELHSMGPVGFVGGVRVGFGFLAGITTKNYAQRMPVYLFLCWGRGVF